MRHTDNWLKRCNENQSERISVRYPRSSRFRCRSYGILKVAVEGSSRKAPKAGSWASLSPGHRASGVNDCRVAGNNEPAAKLVISQLK